MSGGWNTIESDAGVFTYLIESLGIKDIQFEELLSLDEHALTALTPVHGVVFLFKYPTDRPYNTHTDRPDDGTFDEVASENIFFAKQTIQNACGTQALLSILLNKKGNPGDRNLVDIGPELVDFLEFAMVLPPDIRGEVLSNSELIRDVHNSFARASPFADETQRTSGEAEDAFHFIAYTFVGGKLYELDGLQPAPISHGPCADEAEFASKVMEVIQRRIARYADTEIRFNLLAVCRDLRIRARETHDVELLARERRKRRDWRFENALRRHNFVGFAGEVLKGTVKARMEDGGEEAFKKWVDEGLQRRKAEEQAMRRLKKAVAGGDDDDVEMDE